MPLFRSLFSSKEPSLPQPRAVGALEAAKLVSEGKAILVDVREPAEWAKGVAEPAHLLSVGDLKEHRDNWTAFLREHADKEVILYCQAGGRAATAARLIAAEGIRSANLGGLSTWSSAGLPLRKP